MATLSFYEYLNIRRAEIPQVAEVGSLAKLADVAGRLVPFEVKYRSANTGVGALKGLAEFCEARKVQRGCAEPRSTRRRFQNSWSVRVVIEQIALDPATGHGAS